MLKRKVVYITSLTVIVVFIAVIFLSTYVLNKVDINEVRKKPRSAKSIRTNKDVENEIRLEYLSLQQYKTKNEKPDKIINNFIQNVNISNKVYNRQELDVIWRTANKWVTKEKLYDLNDKYLGNVINILKTTKITNADIYPRGTQLKLLLTLQGDQKVVFKPQWYNKEKVIIGNVYAGNDRYGAEILAFYLSGFLNIPLAPIATERIVNVNAEILPVASKILHTTSFQKDNISCIYGKCFYCSKDKPVCESNPGKMHGAIIFHIPGKFNSHRSPWQRTYQKGKKALWEYEENYCQRVKQQLQRHILLDLIDTAIFDFLIQNGDRHHYETLNEKVILFDNGKGLGNPDLHHIDILAPLYQCCILRKTTLERCKILSELNLALILNSLPQIVNVVTDKHLNAIEDRLIYILATVERCAKENKLLLY